MRSSSAERRAVAASCWGLAVRARTGVRARWPPALVSADRRSTPWNARCACSPTRDVRQASSCRPHRRRDVREPRATVLQAVRPTWPAGGTTAERRGRAGQVRTSSRLTAMRRHGTARPMISGGMGTGPSASPRRLRAGRATRVHRSVGPRSRPAAPAGPTPGGGERVAAAQSGGRTRRVTPERSDPAATASESFRAEHIGARADIRELRASRDAAPRPDDARRWTLRTPSATTIAVRWARHPVGGRPIGTGTPDGCRVAPRCTRG